MLLKDGICHHDGPMLPWRVTCRCCIALVQYVKAFGVSEPRRVGMMPECSTGNVLGRAAFMHHDDQGHDALMYYADLN